MSRPPLLFRPSADAPSEPEPSSSAPGPATATALDLGLSAARPDPTSPQLDSITAFQPENEIRYKTQQRRPASNGPGLLLILLVIGIVGAILGLTVLALRRSPSTPARAAAPAQAQASGQAQFDSRPSGADVIIDGVVRGKTPLKLSLPVGAHTLEITGEAGSRSLPLNIDAGILVSQYVELLATPDLATGRLDVTSEPAGAQVRVDGVAKGTTPLSLDALEAREHAVVLTSGSSTILRTVKIAPGATASLFVAMGAPQPAPGAVGGFLSLRAPFELQVYEGGRLLGTTSTERLMLPTGRHDLELVGSSFQFKRTLTVNIEAGKVASPAVAIPSGLLSINALPWADVFIDGRSVGTTPLANLSVPIGNHEVLWRHPQLGERKQTVAVTEQTPVRVGVNLGQ
jgi:hypothetical protein